MKPLHLSRVHRYGLSILSGLLLFLSFPYSGSLTFLTYVAWIPLLIVEREIILRRLKSAPVFLHAYVCFLIYNIGSTWWIWFASPGGALMAFILNSLLMSLAFFLFHWIGKRTGRMMGYFSFIVCWIGFEYLHHHWELSWPWLSLGNVFSIHPMLIQWYSITGISGGTLWILSINLLLFHIIERLWIQKKSFQQEWRLSLITCLILLMPIITSVLMYYQREQPKRSVECVVVQPNIDPYLEKFTSDVSSQLDKTLQLASKKVTSRTELVIAPETAISQGFFEEEFTLLPFYDRLITQVKKWENASLLIGASTATKFPNKHSRASRPFDSKHYYEAYNSALFLNRTQAMFYHKSKLVLGVEKLPFSDWFPFLEQLSIENGGTSGTLGVADKPEVLRTDRFSFAPLICYESIYGEFNAEQCAKGAEAIVVITNDGWWRDTPGYKQHASFSRLRAIENQRYVARSANTGISCFINNRGEQLQQTGWWQPAVLRETIGLFTETTFYSRNGDVIGRAALVAALLTALFALLRPMIRKKPDYR
jgi:apolipoprotein N-acyltransferase